MMKSRLFAKIKEAEDTWASPKNRRGCKKQTLKTKVKRFPLALTCRRKTLYPKTTTPGKGLVKSNTTGSQKLDIAPFQYRNYLQYRNFGTSANKETSPRENPRGALTSRVVIDVSSIEAHATKDVTYETPYVICDDETIEEILNGLNKVST